MYEIYPKIYFRFTFFPFESSSSYDEQLDHASDKNVWKMWKFRCLSIVQTIAVIILVSNEDYRKCWIENLRPWRDEHIFFAAIADCYRCPYLRCITLVLSPIVISNQVWNWSVHNVAAGQYENSHTAVHESWWFRGVQGEVLRGQSGPVSLMNYNLIIEMHTLKN